MQILAKDGASSGVIVIGNLNAKSWIGETVYLGNKVRAGRVSCLRRNSAPLVPFGHRRVRHG